MADDTIPGDRDTSAAEFPVAGAVVNPDSGADEPMTAKQAARLRTLCEKHDEAFDANLTREQADARIDALERG